MAQDFPAQYGRRDQYQNPDSTLPMPSPGNMPRPQWYSNTIPFRWELSQVITEENGFDPFPPGYIWAYAWTSPTFDLRPDLRSANSGPKDGVPIWSLSARLYFQLMGDARGTGDQPTLLTPNLTVTAQDLLNTTFNFSTKTRPAEGLAQGAGLLGTPPRDVSSKFNTPPASPAVPSRQKITSVLAGFSPPGTALGFGEGYAVRFWRVQLLFKQFVPWDPAEPEPIPPVPPADNEASPYIFQVSVY